LHDPGIPLTPQMLPLRRPPVASSRIRDADGAGTVVQVLLYERQRLRPEDVVDAEFVVRLLLAVPEHRPLGQVKFILMKATDICWVHAAVQAEHQVELADRAGCGLKIAFHLIGSVDFDFLADGLRHACCHLDCCGDRVATVVVGEDEPEQLHARVQVIPDCPSAELFEHLLPGILEMLARYYREQ
jgi:hypothetical protein